MVSTPLPCLSLWVYIRVPSWARCCFLSICKSEVTLVGSQDKLLELCPFLASGLSLAGSPISLSPSTRILGVTFDSSLNFDSRVSEICKTITYHLNALAHIRR